MYSGQVVRSLQEIVICEMPRVRGRTLEQKRILWENALSYFARNGKKFPDEIRAMLDCDFGANLGYNERFCSETGIGYSEIDRNWDDIRAAIALRYIDETSERKEAA